MTETTILDRPRPGTGRWSRFGVIGLTCLVAFTLQSCREAEQGRPLSYEKGVYGGAPDEEIDEETRKKLRDRVQHQSFN